MREKDFEAKGFPCLLPTGNYGLDHPREFHLPAQMYFVQRLLNQDLRFAKSIPYLFMAFLYVERQMLEKQINVSGMRGSLKSDGDVVQLSDAFSIFARIRGSQKYWQVARHELVAKVKQLGPFHIFLTLSCAEMR